ncbi:formylglycine-generating enzyme family protein [Myxococcota bacterium]|nr:formylglycine-generating enzyme family protein [Myxococcota bacterium]
MEFVLIPAGTFQMGTPTPTCPKDDPFTEKDEYADCMDGVSSDEMPVHRVTISKPFYLGKTEVTQAQWVAVMGTNPARFKTEKAGEDSRNHPVENVSWDDVQTFIGRLNAKEGTTVHRLPSEAEWEYACRAGSMGAYGFGNDVGQLRVHGWFGGNSGGKTHAVAQLRPNAWGLYDMHGNVWEWVEDRWAKDFYASSPPTDPRGASSSSYRAYRGGSYTNDADFTRSATRGDFGTPYTGHMDLGFRLAKSVP